MAKRGLYANIHAKRKRIKAGSGEMRKVELKVHLPPLILEERLRHVRKGSHGCEKISES